MTSIERVIDYSKINSEFETNNLNVDDSWPRYGSIRFENVSFSYDKHLPKVLKNCNLEVKSMEKIGVIGRTGNFNILVLQKITLYFYSTKKRIGKIFNYKNFVKNGSY